MKKRSIQKISSEELQKRQKLIDSVLRKVNTLGGVLANKRRKDKMLSVIGEGSLASNIIFIGEAPGKNEAKTGKPFCGASGKLLDKLLASIDVKREEIYVANIVKDRPPENRDPKPSEIALYAPFLDMQIDIIKPKVIATLGRFSMAYVLERYASMDKIPTISEAHGKSFTVKVDWGMMTVVPLYHPAVGLYTHSKQPLLFKDFKQITASL